MSGPRIERVSITPGVSATRKLGEDEYVTVSHLPAGGLAVSEEMHFTNEVGEKHSEITTTVPRGIVAMNNRENDTVYVFEGIATTHDSYY